MKIRNLVIFWIIFCIACILCHFSLQELHFGNLWDSIGLSQARMDSFVSIALILIELTFILGCSVFTGIFLWKGIFSFTFSGDHWFKFPIEMLQAWITLSGFEISIIIYAEISSVLIKGDLFPIYSNINDIISINWINLILVSLFYAFIGFQALRKNLKLERFILRVAFDIGQVTALTIIGLLILIPFGLSALIMLLHTDTIMIYFYYIISFIGTIEIPWSLGRRIGREQELSQEELNSRIFFLQGFTILISLFLIFNLFPIPFFIIIMMNGLPGLIFLFVVCPVVSFSIIILYHFVKKLSPELVENFESSIDQIKFKFEALLALRGSMFNYPRPVGILDGGEKMKMISGRWEKVTLKMACGNCYYVFQTQVFKDGSKVKPVPCPFCGSMGTTPIWE
ncbi:MAG: hypothetical protein ACFFFH_00120 [Candidatus Thorarchaeota archaeon]